MQLAQTIRCVKFACGNPPASSVNSMALAVRLGEGTTILCKMSAQAAPISCYIRTLSEERTIGRTVAAVRDVVAEIVIVDSGSKDATIAIAQAEGARVIRQDWLGRLPEALCRTPMPQ